MRLALIALATLAYPLLVWLGMAHLEPRWLAVGLAVLALARAVATRERVWLAAAAGALLLAAVAALGNALLPLKLYPALVNAVLLTVFAVSLIHPPSAIERLARLREPDLPPAAIAYTRTVTWVWCGFFVVNGTLALATALWADAATWALYNGLIAYGLIGVLFAGEWLVRRRVRARHAAAGDLR
ncbi:MAG: hypothetical protein DI564_08920 [Rhodanobacter denitrificans]|uniref:DNA gyrase subunit B n=1 Tax=Rhodanobacter denitrificans TaxID=666685 RepID=A0A2W5KEZ7_9GAMM|nr:MAG: hypothetical protein DI564_08920 [Rhodanobacter denitrificans]